MTPMIHDGPSAYQPSHNLFCRLLRKALADGVKAAPGATGGIGSVQFRTSATLYALLMAHPLDREGRCQSCRDPGAIFRRRHRYRVHIEASYWLRQPEELLHARVIQQWDLADQSPPGTRATPAPDIATHTTDPDDTDVLPVIANDPPTQPLQTPAIPPSTAPAGWPDPDHGGVGEHPERPRLHRGPPDGPSPGPGQSLLLTGGITRQT